jgi:hypothetical protein
VTTLLVRARTAAQEIRALLLSYPETPRNLAGQCGLAAMLVAAALGKAHTLRTGFYMKRETFLGNRGRYPNRHAWCRIGTTIVDATATQFDRGNKAVHVARFDEDIRYIETSCGLDALDDIMTNWRGRELPAYVQIAKKLRGRL